MQQDKEVESSSYIRLAEMQALRLTGNTSKENVQKQLRYINWQYQERKTVSQKNFYMVIMWLIIFAVLLLVVVANGACV